MKLYRPELKHCSLPLGSRRDRSRRTHQRNSSRGSRSRGRLMVRPLDVKSKSFRPKSFTKLSCIMSAKFIADLWDRNRIYAIRSADSLTSYFKCNKYCRNYGASSAFGGTFVRFMLYLLRECKSASVREVRTYKSPSVAVLSYLYIAFDNLQKHLKSRKYLLIDLKSLTYLIRKPGYLWTRLKYKNSNGVFLDTVHRFYQGVIHFKNIVLFPDTRFNVISFT